jgi:Fe-S oxidoreductase
LTITYDPKDPAYWDDGDLRGELTRVFDLCHGCRLCFKFCTAFPTLFEMVDSHDDQDAARLTPADQEQVVHECFNCKLCYVNCPYIPGQSEWNLDFPRLMMRADQVRVKAGEVTAKSKLQNQALARTDLIGKLNVAAAPLANKAIGTPGSFTRKVMEKTVGIASERVLPPYAAALLDLVQEAPAQGGGQAAGQGRRSRRARRVPEPGHRPRPGQVYERNGIECSLPKGRSAAVRRGCTRATSTTSSPRVARTSSCWPTRSRRQRHRRAQPTCGYVLKKDYVDYIGGPDAQLVADNTYDASEYLMKVHKGEGTELDTDFTGEIPEALTYHAPCHLRAQNIGLRSRDLMKLTGTKITLVAECSAIDGTWGYREQNYEISRKVAGKMAKAIEKAGNDVVAGDCNLANGGILQETGTMPVHPIQVVARATASPKGLAPRA